MDSKTIYSASDRIKTLVVWPLLSDTEWEYFGAEQETDREKAGAIIDKYFEENHFYVAHNRQDSFECNRQNVDEKIAALLGSEDFIVWNKSFTKAIEFNKIGVLRRGKVSR